MCYVYALTQLKFPREGEEMEFFSLIVKMFDLVLAYLWGACDMRCNCKGKELLQGYFAGLIEKG